MNSSSLLACTLLVTAAAQAQMSPSMPMPKAAPASSATAPATTDGVVQAVDKANGVVTLKHGEIVNMKMGPMTMAFNVADKRMLDKVKTGDKVRFRVEDVRGSPTVTLIMISP